MAKLLGRLGWRGQCACCDGPKGKRQIKREEEAQWRAEYEREAIALQLARKSIVACRTCGSVQYKLKWLQGSREAMQAEAEALHPGHEYQLMVNNGPEILAYLGETFSNPEVADVD